MLFKIEMEFLITIVACLVDENGDIWIYIFLISYN